MNAIAMSSYRTLSDFGYATGPILLGLCADWLGAGTTLGVAAVMLFAIGLLFAKEAPEIYRPRAVKD